MKAYQQLSRIPALRKRFNLKFLFVAFVGIHIPLFGIIAYLISTSAKPEDAWLIGGITLVATLLATLATLWILNSLLKPVIKAKEALNAYIRTARQPALPTDYQDEAGVLMRDVQMAINTLEQYEDERWRALQLLSHDLQSPLRSIQSIAQLMKTEQDPAVRAEFLGHIEESVQALLQELEQIIQQLKDRNESVSEEGLWKPVNLDDLLASMEARFRLTLLEEERPFEWERSGLDLLLPEQALRKSLINVLSNALKYSPPGSPITISCSLKEGVVSLAVRDEGQGFAQEDLHRIFKYNNEISRDRGDSHGLGLNLCQRLLNQQGGEIKAHSAGRGKGATFTIVVPFRNLEKQR